MREAPRPERLTVRRLAGRAGRWLSGRAKGRVVQVSKRTALAPAEGRLPALRQHGVPGSRLRYLETEPAETLAPTRRRPSPGLLFLALPLLLTALYLVFVASDRYTSQTSFVIREGGLGTSAMTAGGLARNDESSHAVLTYFHSRAASEDLSASIHLKSVLGRPEGDLLTRFPLPWASDTAEDLHKHLQGVMSAELDSRSGITSLEVVAYRPEDALAIVDALLERAETLVNAMNRRASEDAVAFARGLVAEGEERMRDVQGRLSEFRNSQAILDPGAQSGAQLALIAELTRSATELDTEIAQLRSSASRSPRLNSLAERRRALGSQIDTLRIELAGSSGSLAPKISTYELLALERELAVKSLSTSYRALEQARQEADSRRLYLQRISAPNLADRPSHPRSLRILLLVAVVSLGVYWIGRFLVRVTMEHRF